MPNILTTPPEGDCPPITLDDLRSQPGRLLTLRDLADLGIVHSYTGAQTAQRRGKLPAPYRLPSGRPVWEARAILRAIGAPEAVPAEAA